ncbi:hypothetical protein [Thioalkalivibrio sp. XN279]|uniref:hypothetical protein n=1 Tax=Thioalkalivibrio sp. XN279 TaxID=2714953 RepID=UPI001409CD16|nr:hypothetical protein [Thioalkalivibrio sp. XN279]NHA14349.1 hypothetical protein [Thioalkalivibrio sp. XN279]
MAGMASTARRAKIMTRPCRLAGALCLLAFTTLAPAQDYLPRDHGLKYTGREGMRPVKVEITLREQPDGVLEYVEWTLPQGWARWFTRSSVRRARLDFADGRLSVLDFDPGDGPVAPPAAHPGTALDEFSVRLRARADIARGLRSAEYAVWRADGAMETWRLEVGEPGTVETPDGSYQALPFRLGTDSEWLDGWSAPLLVFHFVQLEHWRDDRQIGTLRLEDKQL